MGNGTDKLIESLFDSFLQGYQKKFKKMNERK